MFNYIYLDNVSSTMDKIKEFPNNTVVISNTQSSGRGKAARTWISKKSNNLYMTFSIDAVKKDVDYSIYSFLTAICLIKTLEAAIKCRVDLKSKWPNDILLNNKKICGILLELDIQKGFLAIGVGLNIDSSPVQSENMLFESSNLKKEGFLVTKEVIISKFFDIFEKYSTIFLDFGFDLIRKEWIKYAYNFKSNITVKINDSKITGIFEDLNQKGSLILKDNSNEIIEIRSADVF